MYEYAELAKRTWRTREGVEMTWREMTCQHLRNSANFLENAYHHNLSNAYEFYSVLSGEQAQYAMESTISSLEEEGFQIRTYVDEMRAYADFKGRSLENTAANLKLIFGSRNA